jgi:hypothetical protein
MTDKEALIERLATTCHGLDPVDPLRLLVDDVIAALAQPEQEPVAILNHAHGVHTFRNVNLKGLPDGEYLVYTHPPQRTEQEQRTWVGLTDDEYAELAQEYGPFAINRVEAKLKEKNT